MKEIPGIKKLEVGRYYISGYPYSDIENRAGVSHSNVVNIVKELEDGKLTIVGTAFDRVNDLRQLSIEIKKKGLELSQALLWLLLFARLRGLEITPELAKKLLPVDFPAKDFLGAGRILRGKILYNWEVSVIIVNRLIYWEIHIDLAF